MQEAFLQYLWKHSLFANPLKLSDGTDVDIINVGTHNHDSGPDFFNAKVKIGDTTWAGNVELHVKASDWYKHNHQNDEAYDNIVLHVVADNDSQIYRKSGEPIPTAALNCEKGVYEQYLYLMQSNKWVPCETFVKKVDQFTIFQWKESLMVERLKTKASVIERRWLKNEKNFDETFYQTLAANFGFKINSVPFEMMAKQLPMKYLLKHKNDILNIEAMLFGVSGLLPANSSDSYTISLIQSYAHFQNKFGLKPLNKHLWKYSKLRPSNFPNIRIAQFANIIYKNSSLVASITEASDIKEIKQKFIGCASEYWDTHSNFDIEGKKRQKKVGDMAFHNIVINTIAPYFVFYAQVKNCHEYTEKAIHWLSNIEPEQNNITKHWQQLGLELKNAFDSQSLIQLKNIYCNLRKCLNCRIGNKVIQHKF